MVVCLSGREEGILSFQFSGKLIHKIINHVQGLVTMGLCEDVTM